MIRPSPRSLLKLQRKYSAMTHPVAESRPNLAEYSPSPARRAQFANGAPGPAAPPRVRGAALGADTPPRWRAQGPTRFKPAPPARHSNTGRPPRPQQKMLALQEVARLLPPA
jgi:hypothetical protein